MAITARSKITGVVSHLLAKVTGRGGTRLHTRGSLSTPGPVVSTKPDGRVVCDICGPVPVPASEHLDWHREKHRLTGKWS